MRASDISMIIGNMYVAGSFLVVDKSFDGKAGMLFVGILWMASSYFSMKKI